MFPFSPSIGLAAPHPLTERRRKRVGRNTSETGECVSSETRQHKKETLTFKGFANSYPHSDRCERKTIESTKGYIPVERKKRKDIRKKSQRDRGRKDRRKRQEENRMKGKMGRRDSSKRKQKERQEVKGPFLFK